MAGTDCGAQVTTNAVLGLPVPAYAAENDGPRSTRVLINACFLGIFALEYEEGPWDGVEDARYLLKKILAAL